jgi:hypothetical protein
MPVTDTVPQPDPDPVRLNVAVVQPEGDRVHGHVVGMPETDRVIVVDLL